MRVSDLLQKAVLKKETRRDLAYLFRLNANKTYQLRLLNVEEILSNPASTSNIVLQPEDRLILYTQERYTRKDNLTIGGAVRTPSEYPFDPNRRVRVSDLVNLAGGLLPSATTFAYITHTDTTNSKIISYENIDIQQAIKNPGAAADMVLKPNDYVFVFSKESFMESGYVRVSGSVRSPGEYKFARGVTLKEVLTMSNGLKLEAATNRVDIYRIVLDSVNPVRTVAATIAMDSNMNIIDSRYQSFALEPYDQIVVRSLPEFSFQKIVNIVGEVKYPGPYALLDKNEKLSSLIQRAGGLNDEAFIDGTTLNRSYQNVGYIIMNLKEALGLPQTSQYNIVMQEGDLLEIPRLKDFVTIKGATKAGELYAEKILNTGRINVPYTDGKNAWYYVDNFAAGVSKDGRKRLISVYHPNGEVKRTKHFLFLKFYPKVRKGTIVTVGYKEIKPPKPKEEKKQRADFDWRKATVDLIASATSLLTIALLLNQLSK
jgi:protein involved in polysaccharide export with SLBB domain